MTTTQDPPVAAVEEPKQPTLELGAPPRWRDQVVSTEAIRIEAMGSPPDADLIQKIEVAGVLTPLLVSDDDGTGFRVIDGRRRLLAAIKAGIEEVPCRVFIDGDLDLFGPTITLETNDAASPNPIIELEAIESLMVERPRISLPAISKATGVKLKTLRRRMKLVDLSSPLREGWKAGRFGTKVGEAAARCDKDGMRELEKRLEANGTLTIEDVKEVRKSGVVAHQRTMKDDRWKARAIEAVERVKKDIFLAVGQDAADEVADATAKLIEAIRDLEE